MPNSGNVYFLYTLTSLILDEIFNCNDDDDDDDGYFA